MHLRSLLQWYVRICLALFWSVQVSAFLYSWLHWIRFCYYNFIHLFVLPVHRSHPFLPLPHYYVSVCLKVLGWLSGRLAGLEYYTSKRYALLIPNSILISSSDGLPTSIHHGSVVRADLDRSKNGSQFEAQASLYALFDMPSLIQGLMQNECGAWRMTQKSFQPLSPCLACSQITSISSHSALLCLCLLEGSWLVEWSVSWTRVLHLKALRSTYSKQHTDILFRRASNKYSPW